MYAIASITLRTRETYERLRLETERLSRQVARLHLASAQVYLECLKKAKMQIVLFLRHNPGISNFATAMTAPRPSNKQFGYFPTCATWVANFEISQWKDLRAGIGVSIDFAVSRELMEASGNR